MKLLIIINSLATGGAEKIVCDSLLGFTERGIQVDLLLLNGKRTPFLDKLGSLRVGTIHIIKHIHIYNPLIIFKIIPFLKKADLVHVHLFPSLYWVAFAKLISFSKTPLVFTEHSTVNRRRKFLFFRFVDRFIYKQYHAIITISTEVKLFLKKHLELKNSYFKTIHNGVDLSVFQNAIALDKKQFKIKKEEKILIQVARFTKEKDYETLLKSIPFVDKPIKLLLVGNGPLQIKMKELAQILEIEEKVLFLGIRQDVPALLKMADIAILSSNHEGLSLFGIEAMASGKPLIASKVSGLSTLVHGAGLLFKHKDYLDLAKNINQLLDSEVFYKSITESCIHRSKIYSLDKLIDAHVQFYTQLCAKTN
ncbi:MAG: glycosyltransferase family 4 protein [Flavobacteriaceae bacterium]